MTAQTYFFYHCHFSVDMKNTFLSLSSWSSAREVQSQYPAAISGTQSESRAGFNFWPFFFFPPHRQYECQCYFVVSLQTDLTKAAKGEVHRSGAFFCHQSRSCNRNMISQPSGLTDKFSFLPFGLVRSFSHICYLTSQDELLVWFSVNILCIFLFPYTGRGSTISNKSAQ